MKKIYFLIIMTTLCLMQGNAQFQVNGLTYEPVSNTVYEGKYQHVRLIAADVNLSGNIVIPELPGTFEDGVVIFRVTEIGKLYPTGGAYSDPFDGCEHITSVTVPKSVTNIVWNVFGNRGLTAIHVDEANTTYTSVDGILYSKDKTSLITCPRGKTGEVVIDRSTLHVINLAFQGRTEITSLIIPHSVQTIEAGCLYYMPRLTSVNVEADNSAYSSANGVLFNKEKTAVVRYPPAKTETAYTIPDTAEEISFAAFEGCTNLASVLIPHSVKKIDKLAFESSGLTAVAIPASVTYLGDAAFRCEWLNDVTVFWTDPASTLFESNPEGYIFSPFLPDVSAVTLHVPPGATAAYLASDVWKEFNIVDDAPVTGITNVETQASIIHSHPATDFITISGLQGNETLDFYAISGQRMLSCKATGETENIPVGHLPAGVYFVKTGTGESLKWIKK
ncbi:MAG: leucine-rich repeat protein [Dysgonamonadaceae bacterium]|jgi:hypothetical protein|nr:leucine-rich repeat protein [Dysgonamonadaceae bacterium]